MQGDTDGREGDTDDGEDANRLQPSNIIPEIGVVTCMHIRRLCQQASLCLALYLKFIAHVQGKMSLTTSLQGDQDWKHRNPSCVHV